VADPAPPARAKVTRLLAGATDLPVDTRSLPLTFVTDKIAQVSRCRAQPLAGQRAGVCNGHFGRVRAAARRGRGAGAVGRSLAAHCHAVGHPAGRARGTRASGRTASLSAISPHRAPLCRPPAPRRCSRCGRCSRWPAQTLPRPRSSPRGSYRRPCATCLWRWATRCSPRPPRTSAQRSCRQGSHTHLTSIAVRPRCLRCARAQSTANVYSVSAARVGTAGLLGKQFSPPGALGSVACVRRTPLLHGAAADALHSLPSALNASLPAEVQYLSTGVVRGAARPSARSRPRARAGRRPLLLVPGGGRHAARSARGRRCQLLRTGLRGGSAAVLVLLGSAGTSRSPLPPPQPLQTDSLTSWAPRLRTGHQRQQRAVRHEPV
jgi:hypothetical protein